jgi:phage baseplate assembly protein W
VAIIDLAYPFQGGSTSFPAASSDGDVVADSIRRIIATPRGERVFRDTGSDCQSFVFESTGASLKSAIGYELRRAISSQEPRARVRDVIVDETERSDGGTEVDVTVVFELNGEVLQTTETLSR